MADLTGLRVADEGGQPGRGEAKQTELSGMVVADELGVERHGDPSSAPDPEMIVAAVAADRLAHCGAGPFDFGQGAGGFRSVYVNGRLLCIAE